MTSIEYQASLLTAHTQFVSRSLQHAQSVQAGVFADHGEIARGRAAEVRVAVGRHRAGIHKADADNPATPVDIAGGKHKAAGKHVSGARRADDVSWSPFQTGGSHRYEGRHSG